MNGRWHRLVVVASSALLAMLLSIESAAASAEKDFFAGKSVKLLIPTVPGGALYGAADLMVRHLGHHIEGKPKIVPQIMQGAGGLAMANYLANVVAADGLTIGLQTRGVLQQAVERNSAVKFDLLEQTWLGTMSSGNDDVILLLVRRSHGIKSVDDMRNVQSPVILGGVPGLNTSATYASIAPELFGFKTKLIRGYQGTIAVKLAIERGEIDGMFVALSSLVGNQRATLESGELVPIIQVARKTRHPRFADVPLGHELISNEADRSLLAFADMPFYTALPYSAPKGVPAGRARALQDAFMKVYADPNFLSDARAIGLDVSPLDGGAVKKLLTEFVSTPEPIIDRYKRLVGS